MKELMLIPAKNGGWVIQKQHSDRGVMPVFVAAFTNTDDLVSGLKKLLNEGGDQ